MARVKVRIPENVSLNVGGRIHRAGDELEVPRDETLEQWLSAGFVTEVKQTKRKTTTNRRKASGSLRRK
jgi:hypothetical protein